MSKSDIKIGTFVPKTTDEIAVSETAVSVISPSPYLVEIKNADVYCDGELILHQINCRLQRHQHCFILGANGSGKTTLVKLLLGHLHPVYPGKVNVLGYQFGCDNLQEMRQQIGLASPLLNELLSQNLTVRELVVSGLHSNFIKPAKIGFTENQVANEVMAKFGIIRLSDRRYRSLSSGEQLRTLIARSMIKESTKLLILDEPSVYLDPAGREQFLAELQLLMKQSPGLTVIFITQRIEDILPEFNYGLLLKSGKIFSAGNRTEILTEKNLAEIFQVNLRLIPGCNGRLWSVIEPNRPESC